MMGKHPREWAVALLFAALLVALRIAAPAFYNAANIRDILLGNAPVLICAIGSTLATPTTATAAPVHTFRPAIRPNTEPAISPLPPA